MTKPSSSTPISALHEILAWSQSRPGWQRDALRRIIVHGEIQQSDIEELFRQCRAAHQLDQDASTCPRLLPLSADHLPPSPGESASVNLHSIGKLSCVNRIPQDRSIEFGDGPGLTIIYGENGAGKSGFVRVIKKACRCRGSAAPIRPNVFEANPHSKAASAELEFSEGGKKKGPIQWVDNQPTDPSLGNVFVFDTHSADHYFHEDSAAVFTPMGLDILTKLSSICDIVSDKFKTEIDALNKMLAENLKNWVHPETSEVGKLLKSLSAKTREEEVETLAKFSEEDAIRLDSLNETLRSDPKKKAGEIRAAAKRLRDFAAKVSQAAIDLSEKSFSEVFALLEDSRLKAAAAKAFSDGQFDLSFLTGTGSGLWRDLWEAARIYSTDQAYPNLPYPKTDDLARCVLCQQELGTEGVQNLNRFESYCTDRSQSLSKEASLKLQGKKALIERLLSLAPELTRVDADLTTGLTASDQLSLNDYVTALDCRLVLLRTNLTSEKWTVPDSLRPPPTVMIARLAENLDNRAIEQDSAIDPVARVKLQTQRDNLKSRQWLSENKQHVLAHMANVVMIARLQACHDKNTRTTSITSKNKDITRLLVTEAFRSRFEQEVKTLGLKTLGVMLEETSGRKGTLHFGLRLAGTSGGKPGGIASEGEQRCIVLAMFLAELSQASHQSALVFDDPVSSLDHRHRDRIAVRLSKEAGARQVIVFTHDAVFADALISEAEKRGIAPVLRHLHWGDDGLPGRCSDGHPWELLKPADRLDKLEKLCREISKKWNPIPSDDNRLEIQLAYSKLRATLERIVENSFFCNVITRFRAYINVSRLHEVVGFTQQECDEFNRLTQKCHDVTEAHDAPLARQSTIPDPTQLAQDIEDTKKLLALTSDRIKASKGT